MSVKKLNKEEFLHYVADWEHASLDGSVPVKANRPMVVVFSASWCGPCRMLSPVLDDVAADYDGRVKFFKVDIDDNRETADAYRIRSVPTLLFFNRDGTMERHVGTMTRNQLSQTVSQMSVEK